MGAEGLLAELSCGVADCEELEGEGKFIDPNNRRASWSHSWCLTQLTSEGGAPSSLSAQ